MRVYAVVLSVLAVVLGIVVAGPGPGAAAANEWAVVPIAAQSDTADPESSGRPESGTGSEGQANPEMDDSKVIVAGIAAVLLGLVAWGRWYRKKQNG